MEAVQETERASASGREEDERRARERGYRRERL